MSLPTREHKPRPFRPFLWIYQWLLVLFGCGYLIGRLLRRREIAGLPQRLGWYPKELTQRAKVPSRSVWIHLVSVGEVMAAQPLIEELRRLFPSVRWVITTVTSTGQRVARRLLQGPNDLLLYLPWDLALPVRRAIRTIRPSLFLSWETEIWPVLFDELWAAGVPIALVNGRISPKAYRRYLWVRPLLQRTWAQVDLLLAQGTQDARRFALLGFPKDRILVTGNVKWDLSQGALKEEGNSLRALFGLSPETILFTAGSTHPGEEEMILRAFQSLKPHFPHLRLLIAPRHPERSRRIEREILRSGYPVLRRSQAGSSSFSPGGEPVILWDTVGELADAYQASDLVFVGGSLVPHGGHNLVEPAVFRRPILTGPFLSNIQDIAESFFQVRGAILVWSVEDLTRRIRYLLEDPPLRQELGERAFEAIQEHRGALARTADPIRIRYQGVLVP